MASTGNRIQARREALGLTRAELAQKLSKLAQTRKITRLKVWRVENGKIQVPSDDLTLWAKALRIKAAELVA